MLIAWVMFVAASMLNASLRARAEDVGFALHGQEIELPLGGLPSLWFQQHIYSIAPSAVGIILAAIHVSWFCLPWLPAAYLTVKRHDVTAFFASILLLYAITTAAFVVFPVMPPWMTEPGVHRVIASALGTDGHDANQLAAFPSMHVALPALISMWFWSRGWAKAGAGFALYTLLIAVEVVASGEHYVTDAVGGVLAAGGALFVASQLRKVELPRVRLRTASAQRGQNLVEFALMFPAILLFIGIIVVVGLMLHTRSNLQQAVREGARQAAVGASLTQVQNLAAGNSNTSLNSTDVKWCFPTGPTGTTGRVGDPVKVYIFKSGAAGYPYKLVPTGGTFNKLFGASALTVRMGPTATTRLERSVPGSIVAAAGACP